MPGTGRDTESFNSWGPLAHMRGGDSPAQSLVDLPWHELTFGRSLGREGSQVRPWLLLAGASLGLCRENLFLRHLPYLNLWPLDMLLTSPEAACVLLPCCRGEVSFILSGWAPVGWLWVGISALSLWESRFTPLNSSILI